MAKAFEKAVFPKTMSAPAKAGMRVETSSISPLTISIPRAVSANAAGELGLRAMPRILKAGSLRNALATEPPWVLSVSLYC